MGVEVVDLRRRPPAGGRRSAGSQRRGGDERWCAARSRLDGVDEGVEARRRRYMGRHRRVAAGSRTTSRGAARPPRPDLAPRPSVTRTSGHLGPVPAVVGTATTGARRERTAPRRSARPGDAAGDDAPAWRCRGRPPPMPTTGAPARRPPIGLVDRSTVGSCGPWRRTSSTWSRGRDAIDVPGPDHGLVDDEHDLPAEHAGGSPSTPSCSGPRRRGLARGCAVLTNFTVHPYREQRLIGRLGRHYGSSHRAVVTATRGRTHGLEAP